MGKGARVNLVNTEGFSILHAIVEGFKKADDLRTAIDTLVAAGIDIGTKGFTPLHLACKNNNKIAIEKLIEHNAPVNVKDSKLCTPLDAAIRNQKCSRETFELLLSKGATIGDTTKSVLHDTFYYANPHAIEIFLKSHRHEINKKDRENETPLNKAVAGWAPIESVETVLDAGGEVGDAHSSPLHYACKVRSPEAVNLLIRKRPRDINKTDREGLSPLNVAIQSKARGDIINALLDAEGVVKKGLTPLHYACTCGNRPAVGILIERYGDGNVNRHITVGEKGYAFSPLDCASLANNVSIIEWLIQEKGADVNKADKNGWAPLHLAAQEGSFKAVQALVENGARIEQETTNTKEDAIKIADLRNYTRIVEYLKKELENQLL